MSHIQRQGLELSIFNQSQSSPILEDRRGIADGSPTRNELTFEAAAPNLIGQKSRLVIIVFIVSSNIVQMISNMVGLAAGLEFSKALGAVVGPGQANWTAASYPLTQGTFVLISGRLGTVYGHRNVLVAGAVWLVIWSLGNGFCTNYAAFNIARAFSGIGGAFIMPNAMALISTTIPPGKMRNITLGFFSASAPIGSYLGALWAGLFIHYVNWKWIFFSIQQGVAASLIGTLNLYGNSLGLGFAATIETEVNKRRVDQVLGYRAALYLGAGIALLGLVLDALFVRMVKDEREGWADPEDQQENLETIPQGVSTATEFGGT